MITHSTGSTDFHGKSCSPYTMQWVFDTRALAVGTAREITKNGGKSWFFITDDYAFGHSLEAVASEVITKNGGKVRRLSAAAFRFFRSVILHLAGAVVESARSSASPLDRRTTRTRSSSPASS